MTSGPVSTCPRCGHKMPEGEDCANCANSKVFRLVHREILLLVLLAAIALGAYFGTLAFANATRAMRSREALSWYQQGERSLQAGHPGEAVAAFRKATVNSMNNRQYMLALARSLELAGQDKDAQQLLLQMRDASPEDPEINVELGRIAVRQHNVQDAIRYYHNALYGIWTGENIDLRRIQVRRELIRFLLSHHARDQALAEIVALAAHLNNSPASHMELGTLLLQVGDLQNALAHFREALRAEPRNQQALQQAGKAAFQTGDYSLARRFLAAATSPDPESKNMLAVATLVGENDPLQPRLAEPERRRRLISDFDGAAQHVQECLGRQPASANAAQLKAVQDKLEAFRPSLKSARFQSDPSLSFDALELVYEAENAASNSCGQLQGKDMALLLIAQKSRKAEP